MVCVSMATSFTRKVKEEMPPGKPEHEREAIQGEAKDNTQYNKYKRTNFVSLFFTTTAIYF